MSKLKKRVDNLYRRTHVLLSPTDLHDIRDYYESMFEIYPELPTTKADIEKLVAWADANETVSVDALADPKVNVAYLRVERMVEKDGKISYLVLLDKATGDCERFPNGVWVQRSMVSYLNYLSQARSRLAKSPRNRAKLWSPRDRPRLPRFFRMAWALF